MKKLSIILLGKQGVGKSASGNTLLGLHSFHTSSSLQRVTQASSVSMSTVGEQIIEVIDTPGWCDSSQFQTEMKPKIIKFIEMYKPNVFLLLLPIDRFTSEELKTVMNIVKEIGDEAIKNTIVLFTKGDNLDGKPMDPKNAHPSLKEIIDICGERYHVFNNRDKTDQKQISSLLKKINDLVEKNEENLNMKATYEKNKREETLKADNSVPGKNKSPTENEKRHDDQRSSCEAEGKEKEETLFDRKESEKLIQKTVEQTDTIDKTTLDFLKLIDHSKIKDQIETINKNGLEICRMIEEWKNDIQKLGREMPTLPVELDKMKNESHLYENQ